MMDFQKARRNMVDCQIHTAGVILPGLLQSFETVPREKFAPRHAQATACRDQDLPLGEGRFLLEPMVQAQMIQALEPQIDHVVLDIGGATGYAAAILSSLVSTVVAVEENETMLDHGIRTWRDLGYFNIVGLKGWLREGNPEHAPYNAILLNGAVESVPRNILSQLVVGGRLLTIIRKSGEVMGEVTMFTNTGDGHFPSIRLFSAGAQYLPGFAPEPVFHF
ncbi:MAG: protein-L-isoaspartate O-methyltransferase [Alphaproteobacteria bacterium]|nr:protein-L-isoaspartate O-methyltransferase [Alphaproteobacteria bacterium]